MKAGLPVLPTLLTCPFSCGALEQVQIAVVHCQRSVVQFKGKFNFSVSPCFNDIYSWYGLDRPFIQGLHSAALCCSLTDGILSCQIKPK